MHYLYIMSVFYDFTFVHCTAFYSPATEALIIINKYPLKGTIVDRADFVFVARVDRRIFFTIRPKRIRGGSTYAECNSGSLKEHLLLARPAIVSLPRLARRDTTYSVQLTKHHTWCTLNWTAEAGRQTGREARKERGRMEDGREGEREQGESWEGGNNRRA